MKYFFVSVSAAIALVGSIILFQPEQPLGQALPWRQVSALGLLVVTAVLVCYLVADLYFVLVEKQSALHRHSLDKEHYEHTLLYKQALFQQDLEDRRHHRFIQVEELRLESGTILAELEEARYHRAVQERDFTMELHERERELHYQDRELHLLAQDQQIIRFRSNEAVAFRHGDQLDLAYVPPQVAKYLGDTVLIPEEEADRFLPPPAPDADELLAHGELDSNELVLGIDEGGYLVRRAWTQLLSLLILGLMGGGKTNTAIWIISQEVRKGASLAILDKHARSDESMAHQLQPFAARFAVPVGDSPQAAMRVIKYVRKVFTDRQNGAPVTTRLLLCVDEFTAIMRQFGSKDPWAQVAEYLQGLIEDLNYEGRKYRVHVVCVGQATNASRSGGTEVRDLFITRIVHGMRAKQAQLLGMTEEKKLIQRLETGEVYIDVEGKEAPFQMRVPRVTKTYIDQIASQFPAQIAPHATPELPPFTERSIPVQQEFEKRSDPPATNSVNGRTHLPERVERLSEKEQKVLELKRSGTGKRAIIEELWNVKKGGSSAYKQAVKEYEHIIEKLTTMGLLPVN